MNIAEKAILFATHVFTGKYRKASKIPAIFHSLEAGSIAASMTDNPEVLSAVVLHDVIEDTDTTETELAGNSATASQNSYSPILKTREKICRLRIAGKSASKKRLITF